MSILFVTLLFVSSLFAQEHHQHHSGYEQSTIMVHGNSFFTQVVQEGPRGHNAFAVPHMLMVDLQVPQGERHKLGVGFMGTFERWTFPEDGYPELLQIGEERNDGQPYLDAQHPHSSPIMGLTFSDTITLSDAMGFKIWFAPRGESGDGPQAFMHRPTGMVNPDAPLGHHIGQDAGHITSTVLGSAINFDHSTLELSAFHGTEPEPSKVDLPLGELNSGALRWSQHWSEKVSTMASAAYVKEPHHGLDHLWRYSASLYWESLWRGWTIHRALIYGLINGYDHVGALNSVGQEFWWQKAQHNIWGRIEFLERTPAQLQITNAASPDDGRWVGALTLGYTRRVGRWNDMEVGVGGSLTKNVLPSVYQAAYGGEPLSGKVFMRLSGMKMWEFDSW